MNRKQRRAAARSTTTQPAATGILQKTRLAPALERALADHQAGRLAEAEAAYKAHLEAVPQDPDALHGLGFLAHQVGRPDVATELFEMAVRLAPGRADFVEHLGVVLAQTGELARAIQALRLAAELAPDAPGPVANLGSALREAAQPKEALIAFDRAIALGTSDPNIQNNRALCLQDLGRIRSAEAGFRRAIELAPDFADAHNNLGIIQARRAKYDEAIASFERALQLRGPFAQGYNNMACAYRDRGDKETSLEWFDQALILDPDYAEGWTNLGDALIDLGRTRDGVLAYQRSLAISNSSLLLRNKVSGLLIDEGRLGEAEKQLDENIQLSPDDAASLSNRATVKMMLGRMEEAITDLHEALKIKNDMAGALANMGNAYLSLGQLDLAVENYRAALDIDPTASRTHSNFMLSLLYNPRTTGPELRAESERWGRRIEAEVPAQTGHANSRDPGRKLRIGYISPDFRDHSLAFFVLPYLKAHDRSQVEIHLYAEVRNVDSFTEQYIAAADGWRVTVGLSDDEVAEMIRADGIDILVEQASHTANNRVGVLARKPAPIQMANNVVTTGLERVDYFLTDPWLSPDGAEAGFTEELIRLDRCAWVYAPPPEAPVPAPPPVQANGYVTFGSYNNVTKVTEQTIATWSRVLAGVPGSRLILKSATLRDAIARERYLSLFAEHGITADRIDLKEPVRRREDHLASYGDIDIALDPAPFNGHTTTCEALWMGVPVITLAGAGGEPTLAPARVGVTMLNAVGLPQLIAGNEEEFVEIATSLALAPEQIAAYRSTIRLKMQGSPLCDAQGLARAYEQAFRGAWRNWCASA